MIAPAWEGGQEQARGRGLAGWASSSSSLRKDQGRCPRRAWLKTSTQTLWLHGPLQLPRVASTLATAVAWAALLLLRGWWHLCFRILFGPQHPASHYLLHLLKWPPRECQVGSTTQEGVRAARTGHLVICNAHFQLGI